MRRVRRVILQREGTGIPLSFHSQKVAALIDRFTFKNAYLWNCCPTACIIFQIDVYVPTNSYSSAQQQDQIELYERRVKCILLPFVRRRVRCKIQFATALGKDAYESKEDK